MSLATAAFLDLRFGLRQICRTLGFALAAILTLALGIGPNTAVFSLLDQALLRYCQSATRPRLSFWREKTRLGKATSAATLELLSRPERRSEPNRDRMMTMMRNVLSATAISVDRGEEETVAKIDLGDIQAGTEEWSRRSFYLGSRVSKAVVATTAVSAHNLGEPINLTQSFEFKVTANALSSDQVIAFGDSL